jgi:PD-(D/E)XK nuclease superfamily
VLRDLSARSDAVWSFLLFTGYLKPVETALVEGITWCKLAVPNTEVAIGLRGMAAEWFATQVGGSNELRSLLEGLLRGDAAVVEKYLGHMVLANLSYFDTASPEPERFYHGLVVGLLAGLGSRYEVRSNRESGLGRCDVMVLPRSAGQPGVVMELKRVDPEAGETREKALAAALKQIRKRDYAAELRERGAAPIHEMAAVFDGKRVYVRAAGEAKAKAAPKVKPGAKAKKAAPARKGTRRAERS